MKMFSFASTLSAGTLLALASITPVEAAPVQQVPLPSASNVEMVQYNQRAGHLNGYRGSRTERPGTRRGPDGYWYPLAAFGAGAVIGGAIAAQPRYYAPAPAPSGINPSHVAWCENRYRSYRAYDNTFQPYNGPRQQCYSPYF